MPVVDSRHALIQSLIFYRIMNTTNKVKFITTSDRQGELVLKYLNKTCQQALNYCQNNNLQSYEDFARTIKVIGDRNAESKGEHLAIRVGVKENDLVLSLANRPQLGTTKSIKMLEHLGSEEKYRYTRSSVEGLLQKKPVKENIEFNSQELSDFSSNENNFSQRGQKNSRLDIVDLIEDKTVSASKEVPEDLLFEVESAKSTTHQVNDAVDELLNESAEDESKEQNLSSSEKKQPQSESKQVKPDVVVKKTKKTNSKSSLADRASKTLMALGRKTDSYTQDTDGMTVMAASLKMGAVGIAFANKLLEKREERKLQATIDRILAAQERTSQLVERSKSIKQKAEEPEIDSNLDLEDELNDDLDTDFKMESDNELDLDDDLDLDDELDLEKDISEQLDKAVKTIDRQLIDIDPDITTEPIVIDRSADFYQQLEQINAALERLEQKLDSLEERIEHLEQLLDKQEKEAKNNVELDSEDDLNVDVWDEDKSDEAAEDLDTQLVSVLLDVSEKYEQINPNSESGIPIGDNCRLCSDRADNKTVITIEERGVVQNKVTL